MIAAANGMGYGYTDYWGIVWGQHVLCNTFRRLVECKYQECPEFLEQGTRCSCTCKHNYILKKLSRNMRCRNSLFL